MSQFFCVGVDHKTCPVEMRERLAVLEKDVPRALELMRQLEGVRECFLISTCNRVEFYARGAESAGRLLYEFMNSFNQISEEELCAYRYLLSGEDVAKHLFRLSCGLESMVVGENEIYGQLKRAFHVALDVGTIDSVLYQLAERALRVGKKARTETNISKGAVSISSVAVELAERIFGRLTGEQVLVLGTGEVSERTMESLVKSGAGKIMVSNRSFERALGIAQKFGAEPVPFDEWLRVLRTSDIVITQTSAPHTIIHAKDVKLAMQERGHKPLFIIDIAVPRDVDREVEQIEDVYLYDIDDLQSVVDSNVRVRKREIEKCEKLIGSEISNFNGWLESLQMKPTIQWFEEYFDQVAEQEIAKMRGSLRISEGEIRRFLAGVRKKLFHRPFRTLKRASKEGTLLRYLQTLRELFSEGEERQKKEPERQNYKDLVP